MHLVQSILIAYLQAESVPLTSMVINTSNRDTVLMGEYNLRSVLPFIPLLSSIGHFATAVYPTHQSELQYGEYAISASLMVYVIATLSGILDIRSLVTLCLLNAVLQWIGHRVETSARGPSRNHLLLLGFSIHTIIWANVATSFYTTLKLNDAVDSVPPMVYTIIITMFGLFTTFGVWAVIDSKERENGFVLLSFLCKTLLIWMMFFGLRREVE